MSFVLRLPREIHLSGSSSNVPRVPSFLEMLQNPHVLLTFYKLVPATQNDIWTSKSAPNPLSFLHGWLRHVLRTTTACTFSLSQLLKLLRSWSALYILTWKCASRHNCVQFFISHLARFLRTRRFSEPTFRPSRATNHWKNTAFRDFPTFSRTCIFFLLTLSLLWSSLFCSSLLWLFPPLLFHLSMLSEVWLLNVLRLSKCLVSSGYHIVMFFRAANSLCQVNTRPHDGSVEFT